MAVALTKAQINMNTSSPDYLLQNLNNVYTYNDPRVYPMSSYSYAIIPTAANDQKMNLAVRQTIADFLDYSVCQGQAEMGKVGYSPLPINLVEASFAQVSKLHSAQPAVDISQARVQDCNNPTFEAGNPSANYLAKVAPQPQPCDKYGQANCTDSGNTGQLNPDQGGAKTSKGTGTISTGTTGNSSGASSGRTSSGTTGSGSNAAGAATGGTSTGGSATSGTHADPVTGQQVANAVSNNGSTVGTGAEQAVGQATVLPQSQSLSTDLTLAFLAGAVLLALLVLPPVVAARLKRNGSS